MLCSVREVYCGTTLSHPTEASRKMKYLKSSLLDDFRLSLNKKEIGNILLLCYACDADIYNTLYCHFHYHLGIHILAQRHI